MFYFIFVSWGTLYNNDNLLIESKKNAHVIKQYNSSLRFNGWHMYTNLYSDGGHSSCEFNCLPSPAEGSVYFHVYSIGMAALAYEWASGRNEDLPTH
jgi:hypothetical protein